MEDIVLVLFGKIKAGDSEAFLMLSDLIEKFYSTEDYISEYELVNNAVVDTDVISAIQERLETIIESEGTGAFKPQAVNLLGMIRNEGAYNVLLRMLHRYTNEIFEKHRILAQCIAAIGKRDHRIVSDHSFSATEWQKNIEDCIKYLESKGRDVII